jgi:hypothetical protein
MLYTSRDPRTTDTKDLSARLRSNGRYCVVGRVLNLCEGGMFVTTSCDLEVAETVSFELWGPDFCYAGRAKVAHQEDSALGLRFLSWDGPVERPVRALVAARLRGQQLESHDADTCGMGRATVRDSREHDRAALSGLSALIEQSPGGGTSRHQVLNMSEHGLGIDGLTLAVGARFSFLLAGHGIHHLGRGRVAHRTGTITGAAVEHWHGAPEAIRGLISGKAELGQRLAHEAAYITEVTP